MNLKIMVGTGMVTLLIAACAQDSRTVQSSDPLQTPSVESESVVALPAQPLAETLSMLETPETAVLDMHRSEYAGSINTRKPKLRLHAPQSSIPAFDFESIRAASAGVNRDRFASIDSNNVKQVSDDPVSTFSIDVDTGAYAVIRRYLNQGSLPPSNAVRIEELINYFDYDYPQPDMNKQPFSIATEVAPAPWNPQRHLVRIGLQGYLPQHDRPAANLVFLVDVSGSMESANKLPLLKNALRLMIKQLDEQDRVTMVVYAGSSGVVLETTAGDRRADIDAALNRLSAGGSTHGSAGIHLAYSMAQQSFIEDGVNRVILATDGDFNVGTVDHDALIDLIARKRDQGIALTTLGFGGGNYNDHLMEQLADHGDGNYAYIDNLNEARKVLVEQLDATLETIARDVKIQVEWNPQQVAEYRLIGYENRLLQREDFNNDRVDAGDIGAGHRVTALYEITLTSSEDRQVDPLRYQPQQHQSPGNKAQELAFIRLRYKQPQADQSQLIEQALLSSQVLDSLKLASSDLRFSAAVAAWGELLRGGEKLPGFNYQDVLELARRSKGKDNHGYRGEFLKLVQLSATLDS